MPDPLSIEIIGFSDAECGPFPCEPDRTCGLEECFPSGSFLPAVDALKRALEARFGDRMRYTLTLLDDGVPDRVKAIIETHHPPLPIVLLNGRVLPIGMISFTRLAREIEKVLAGSRYA
ncbi:MAG TPA: hypothetical protein VMS81_00340 [Methanomicrobiales archaeon]|jgi:hypothetical protein|nr:hypothetical protein [Methanomicrobiales archaeon]